MRPTIKSADQLRRNIRSFMDAVENADRYPPAERKTILRLLTMARGWFAFQEDGEWLLGPAKYVGFADQTPATYEASRIGELNGTVGEKASKSFSKEQPIGSSRDGGRHPALRKLVELAKLNNGTPSTLAVIYEVRPIEIDNISREEEMIVSSIVNLASATTLSSKARAELTRRLLPQGANS